MRAHVVTRKSLEDFSRLKFLLMFLVPFVLLTILIASLLTETLPSDLATLALRQQEQKLTNSFLQLSFLWATGVPVMVLIGVMVSNTLAKEEEDGSLRILLSKPISRREVLLGKFAAIFLFSFAAMIFGLFLSGAVVYTFSGASPTALGGSILSLMPGNVVYAFVISLFLAGLGTALATFTANRLKTGLGVAAIPALLFAFMPLRRVAQSIDVYSDYYLYLVDINYHFGNTFVFVHDAMVSQFTPITQQTLIFITGVYDPSSSGMDPLLGGLLPDIPLAGHVPPVVSFLLLLLVSIASIAGAVYHFERKDIG